MSHSTLKSFRDLRRESTSSTLDRQVSMFGRSATSRTNSGVQINNVTIPLDLMEVHKDEDSPTMKYMKTQVVNTQRNMEFHLLGGDEGGKVCSETEPRTVWRGGGIVVIAAPSHIHSLGRRDTYFLLQLT